MMSLLFGLNSSLNSAIIDGNESRLLALLKLQIDPFRNIGTIDSPIYKAAEYSPNLVTLLLDETNMSENNRKRFKLVKDRYILTAMMGLMDRCNINQENIALLEYLFSQYKGELSATIPFFSEFDAPQGLIFAASESRYAELLETLIKHGASEVKSNFDCMNYGIQAFINRGPLGRENSFIKMLSLLLHINPNRINEYCPRFEGTCLDFFSNTKIFTTCFYTSKYLNQTIQMLIDAGGEAKPETWEYLSVNFGIERKIKQEIGGVGSEPLTHVTRRNSFK